MYTIPLFYFLHHNIVTFFLRNFRFFIMSKIAGIFNRSDPDYLLSKKYLATWTF